MILEIQKCVLEIMKLISERNYASVEKLSLGVRLSAGQMEEAIVDYGRTIDLFPQDKVHLIDIIEVIGGNPKKWSVVAPFWTKEEGKSDLSIELTAIDINQKLVIEIDNIHVL